MVNVEIKSGERVDTLVEGRMKIIQSPEVFSFGMDAVLLSRFPKLPKRADKLILDICAGNGAVGLLASSATKAQIIEIELQEKLADMAERSVELNGSSTQVRVICDDLKNTLHHVASSTVDLIFCNPPYFKFSHEKSLNENDALTIARHEIKTNFETICQVAQQALKPSGHFALVHRPERFLELTDSLRQYNLVPKRIQFVYPKLGSEANLVLIDAVKDGKAGGEKFLSPLIVHESNGNYTDEINKIYFEEKK
ncbi:MAG: tRNA1(Val) (adenine(37)-N6)-methyltransferase [Streptococcaceae bacterium]|jgi:tRNA1(Val) A37 N6-methylase TrmN6|nr:tRNA1(Val) (adenine(37)-N6)-methyltransferase [Streptococcaceae bacterium]